jgi:hypothetical protein
MDLHMSATPVFVQVTNAHDRTRIFVDASPALP